MKRKFKIFVKIKNCKDIFIDGENPGVIALNELEYDIDNDDYKSPMFLKELIERQEELRDSVIEAGISEIIR